MAMQNESLKTKDNPFAHALQRGLHETPFVTSRQQKNELPVRTPRNLEAMSVTGVSEPGAVATGSSSAIDSLDPEATAPGSDIVASRTDRPTAHLASRPLNESSEWSKSPVAQISCLRILALAMLRRIENLEQQTANSQGADLNAELEVRAFEAELIRSALTQTGGRQRRAARLLGMKVTTLNAKIRRYEIVFDQALTEGSGHESGCQHYQGDSSKGVTTMRVATKVRAGSETDHRCTIDPNG